MKSIFIILFGLLAYAEAQAQNSYYYPPQKEDRAYQQHLEEEVRFYYRGTKTVTPSGTVVSTVTDYNEFGYKTSEGKYYIKADLCTAKYRPYDGSDTLITIEQKAGGTIVLYSPRGTLSISTDLSVLGYLPRDKH